MATRPHTANNALANTGRHRFRAVIIGILSASIGPLRRGRANSFISRARTARAALPSPCHQFGGHRGIDGSSRDGEGCGAKRNSLSRPPMQACGCRMPHSGRGRRLGAGCRGSEMAFPRVLATRLPVRHASDRADSLIDARTVMEASGDPATATSAHGPDAACDSGPTEDDLN